MLSLRLIFVASLLSIHQGNAADSGMEDQFNKCCKLGTDWAAENLRCEKFTGPVAGVPSLEQGLCLEAVDICCVRAYHEQDCERGKKNARAGLSCLESSGKNDKSKCNEYQRDCCEGCKLGILTGSLSQGCMFNSFTFGKPWDPAFLECCYETSSSSPMPLTSSFSPSTIDKENVTSTNDPMSTSTTLTSSPNATSDSSTSSGDEFPTPQLDDICQLLKGLLCSDICIPTPGSYRCECPEGKSLMEDGVTCRTDTPINRCESDNPCEHRCTDTGTAVKCECDPGFTLAKDGHSCEQKSATLDTSTTLIYPTSREEPKNRKKPRCPPGYKFNAAARVCDDVDECIERLNLCGDEVCYNQPGGYSCARAPTPMTEPTIRTTSELPSTLSSKKFETCQPGFRYVNNHGCRDVNECLEIEDACSSNEECVNSVGSYTCNCRTGFRRDNFTQACVDINECQLLQNDCLPTQRCDNTLGSYNCVRFLPCGTGYTLNAATEICEDDDECILGTHDCSGGYHCRNTLGSYRCDKNPRGQTWSTRPTIATTAITTMRTPTTTISTNKPTVVFSPRQKIEETCPRGFETGPSGQCIDIDECQRGSLNPCARFPLQRCVNTLGSYQCVSRVICGAGWVLDPTTSRCVDVDECADGTHECEPSQTCENRQGGYVCTCPPGHAVTSSNRHCVDIDECSIYSSNLCGANGRCENTVGSFKCICDPGYKTSASGTVCQDINECDQSPGICQHSCINVWGSYRCSCRSGFRLNSDSRSCEDIDECTEFKDHNLCVGLCDNAPGNYSCRCPEGYRLGSDGRTCQDIDECEAGRVCREPSEMCQNTRGGYRCNKIDCPQGYHQDPNRKNRCIRSSRYCQAGDLECFRSPSHYSFNYISFVSLLPMPASGQLELFTMKGTHLPGSIVRFTMALVGVRAPPGIPRATESYFALRRPSSSQAVLVLTHSIPGPQEIELDLSMVIYHNTEYAGSAVAKLFIYVTQYEF